ncbi:Butyryl-CoA dehydrogenase [Bacillus subtilis]|uniref:acyl-CoA dehydrogenase family protein n=1 Tax=Bacillus subtilis TaxID=1423 RepID=UPI00059B8BB1|nr:acyl-CoA dehydrogenase family protein [Bacillus subtilis]KIN31509.1 Butyryl-CoA dehydrogenase [Bacillus subtilis]KIN56073.1 Butyryl-CoA dehydrogenase [Bacillus subtilis]MCR1991740.1 acyl-CoA dehydrogenase family protein [Bacillus subtilis]
MELVHSAVFNGLKEAINNVLQKNTLSQIDGIEGINTIKDFPTSHNQKDVIWKELIEMGVASYTIPLIYGGYELGDDVSLMLCKEMGKALFSHPFTDSLEVIDILIQIQDEGYVQNKIDSISTGNEYISVVGLHQKLDIVSNSKEYKGHLISGDNIYINHFNKLQSLMVIVEGDLYEISPDKEGLKVEELNNISNEKVYKVTLDNLYVSKNEIINKGPININMIKAKSRLRQASFVFGLAKGALSQTIDYVNSRKQFNKKLVEFQSVSFKLASLLSELEGAELKLELTNSKSDVGESFLQHSTESLAHISELALKISRETLHLHGAYGMTKLSSIEIFYRLIAVEAVRLGVPNDLWLEAGKLRIKEYESLAAY